MDITSSAAVTKAGQQPATLHLISNFAAGQTLWSDYWQSQIASLQRVALPFQYDNAAPVPSLILPHAPSALLSPLFEAAAEQVEQWPTWCTFICPAHQLSETFLLLSTIYRSSGRDANQSSQKQQLVLRFQHERHLDQLEAIAQNGQVILHAAFNAKKLVVPLPDPELALHLEYIRPLFR